MADTDERKTKDAPKAKRRAATKRPKKRQPVYVRVHGDPGFFGGWPR